MQTQRPNARERILALSFYLGSAPWWWLARRRRASAFLEHHFQQAVGVFLILLAVAALFVLVITGLSYTMVFRREWYEGIHLESYLLNGTRKLFLVWLVFWAYGVGLAVFGSLRSLPLAATLGRRKHLATATLLAMTVFFAAATATVPFAVHAASLARQDARPGQVYLLYEDLDKFPRWIFTLGFYRIERAATERWGKDSVVVLKLSEDAIRRSLREGRFVFIGSHGRAHGLLLDSGYLAPGDLQDAPKNPDLQFVYLTGCDSGAQRQAWEAAFAPARVVTHDRLTAVLEHTWWLWFRAPRIIRQLPGPRPAIPIP